MKEIGELGMSIMHFISALIVIIALLFLAGLELWKKHMIEPLRTVLLRLLLEAIQCDRTGQSLYNEKSSTIQGVIQSLVTVEEYKKKNTLETYEQFFEAPFLEATGEYYRYLSSFSVWSLLVT